MLILAVILAVTGNTVLLCCISPYIRQKMPTRQKIPFCAPPTDRTEGTVPAQIGRDCAQVIRGRMTRSVTKPVRRFTGSRDGMLSAEAAVTRPSAAFC
jgi:hypothetical protein